MLDSHLKSYWKRLMGEGLIESIFDNVEIKVIEIDNKPTSVVTIKGGIQKKRIEGTNFIIIYNLARAQRPQRQDNKFIREGVLKAPEPGIDKCRFYCNDRQNQLSLRKRKHSGEDIELKNGKYRFYYNAFPIDENGHYLLVSVDGDDIPHKPQALTQELVEDMLLLGSKGLEGILFFNSINGGATVDHFHMHYIPLIGNYEELNEGKFAIEYANVKKVGDYYMLYDYPAQNRGGLVFSHDDKKVWNCVNNLQEKRIPFNWIFLKDNNYLFPRNQLYEKVREFPDAPASSELLGLFVTTNLDFYKKMTGECNPDGISPPIELNNGFTKILHPSLESIIS